MMLLTTTGRKSGKKRTTPLLYVRDQDRFVVVASNGGSATYPSWWLNLQNNPYVEIEVGRQKIQVVASSAHPDERSRLWALLVTVWPAYTQYQKRTRRQIPIVILQPQD